MMTTTLHVVRPGSDGVLIPPSTKQERHMVVEYGQTLEAPLMVGTAYLHDWPKDDKDARWIDDELRRWMTSRMHITEWPPSQPTIPHLRP